jgi:hypothetical protein
MNLIALEYGFNSIYIYKSLIDYSLDCKDGHMETKICVCLSVSGSKVKGRISETMSIKTRRCYAFVQNLVDRKVNQSDVFVL